MKSDDVKKAIKKGQKFVGRLKREQETANQAWAHFLAIHEAYSASDCCWKQSLGRLKQAPRLFQIADALIRDALMACFRLIDLDTRSVTLLRIHELLFIDAIKDDRLRFFDSCSTTSKKEAQSKIDNFMSYFPKALPTCTTKGLLWPRRDWFPEKWELTDLRSELIPVRNERMAHAGNFHARIPVQKIDSFVRLTDGLVSDAEWIFKGASASTLAARREEATDFWSHVQTGFLLQA